MKFLATAFLLLSGLAAAPAFATDLEALNDAERAAFRDEVREYLMENPEVLMEAIAVLESRQVAAEAARDIDLVAQNAEALFNSDSDWVGGNPEGDLVLVEFLDYRCSYCRRAFSEVEQLLAQDGNIRFIVKEFPILGEESVFASRFALSTRMVAGDEGYASLHDAIMVMRGDVTEASLMRLAAELGLDELAILANIDAPEIDAIIASNYELGQLLQISGTPSFVMGDQLLRGYLPFADMAALADQIRATQQ